MWALTLLPVANGIMNGSLQVEEKTQAFSPCPEPRARAGNGCGKEVTAPQKEDKGVMGVEVTGKSIRCKHVREKGENVYDSDQPK